MPVSLKPFQTKCPYNFAAMFSDILLNNQKINSLTDHLSYEVFCYGTNTTTFPDFLQKNLTAALKSQSDLSINQPEAKMQFLADYGEVLDGDYQALWSGIEGADKQRMLLYPALSDSNRLVSLHKQCSEISVLKELLEASGLYQLCSQDENGIDYGPYPYFVCSVVGRTLFSLRPCCPLCNTLLPDYWFDHRMADFIPIGLVAPHAAGKTTYMTSLLMDDFVPLMTRIGGFGHWGAGNAIDNERESVGIQELRYQNVEDMKNTYYPEATPEKNLPPVMFQMFSTAEVDPEKKQYVIVGIYDSAGERFRKAVNLNDWKYLSYMRDIIYFLEAAQIKKDYLGLSFRKTAGDQQARLLPPQQQGKVQQDNQGKSVRAGELLNAGQPVEEVFYMLGKVIISIHQMMIHKLTPSLKHIAFTIIKSDELKKIAFVLPEEMKACLEEETDQVNPFDRDIIEAKNDIIGQFINTYFRDAGQAELKDMVPGKITYSCHCCSVAAPMDHDEPADAGHTADNQRKTKRCHYHPVRIADPLVGCLYAEFNKLGWL